MHTMPGRFMGHRHTSPTIAKEVQKCSILESTSKRRKIIWQLINKIPVSFCLSTTLDPSLNCFRQDTLSIKTQFRSSLAKANILLLSFSVSASLTLRYWRAEDSHPPDSNSATICTSFNVFSSLLSACLQLKNKSTQKTELKNYVLKRNPRIVRTGFFFVNIIPTPYISLFWTGNLN